MKLLTLNSGNTIPALGLGTWKSSDEDVYQAVRDAIKIGYRHIDCAHIYGNEPAIGKAIADAIADKDVIRKDLFITSKLWNNSHAPEDVIPALRKTLTDLQLDYLDLYLIHWPVVFVKKVIWPDNASQMISLEALPMHLTWTGMEQALAEGFTKNIGVCNLSVKKLQQLLKHAKIPPAVNQVELHPYLQQNELYDFCKAHNIILTAYSPLGSFDRDEQVKIPNEKPIIFDPVINTIAEKHEASAAQILISWALQRPTAVIPKSVNPQHLQDNFTAQEITLDEEDLEQIASLDKHFRYVTGKFFALEGSSYTRENIWDE